MKVSACLTGCRLLPASVKSQKGFPPRSFVNRVDDLGGTSVPFNKGRMESAQHSGRQCHTTTQVNATITQWASREFGGIANGPIGYGRECFALWPGQAGLRAPGPQRRRGPTRAGPDPGGPRRPGRIGAGLRGQDRARSAGHADDSTMTDKRTLEQHGRAMMRIFGFELQTVGVTG